MDEGARFPQVAAKAGHYESFYVKACEDGGGRGVWIRHTVHKRPGAEPTASLWFVLFDRDADGPRAAKMTLPASELSVPGDGWIRIGAAEVGPGYARSPVPLAEMPARRDDGAEVLPVSWDLSFATGAEPCRYLPAEWLYKAPLPRTKFVAPVPATRFEGRIEIGEETIELDGWPGMIGHNWGSEHAERWVWLEGNGFADAAPGDYFDAGAARIKIGSRVTPWVPSGMLMLDGVHHRLGGLGAIRSASISESAGACEFVLPGKDIVVRGRVSAPAKDFVAWVYADPQGPEHHTINCSAADLQLTVERPGRPDRELRLPGGGAYELGMHETDHGIAVQPFPDG